MGNLLQNRHNSIMVLLLKIGLNGLKQHKMGKWKEKGGEEDYSTTTRGALKGSYKIKISHIL